jgi:hypothetical protein
MGVMRLPFLRFLPIHAPAEATRFIGRRIRCRRSSPAAVGELCRWAVRRGASQILRKAIPAEIGVRDLFRFNLGRSTAKRTEVRVP